MKKTINLLILLAGILFADKNISFGEQDSTEKTQTIYCVRFLSSAISLNEKDVLYSIPVNIRKKTHLVKTEKYYLAVYEGTPSLKQACENLNFIRKAGYKDAYVRKAKIKVKTKKIRKKNNNISKFQYSDIIFKADKAYKKGDYMQAMIYYEMLLATGSKNNKIKNNLCYLYGRIGAFEQAKEIIQNTQYPSRLIYAYAYGATLTQQDNFYKNLSKYILLDRSGHLLLLSANYFERKGDLQKAISFYKMAYKQNPSDPYIVFAYARAYDMQEKTDKALFFYKQLANNTDKTSQIYKIATKRIYQIEGNL